MPDEALRIAYEVCTSIEPGNMDTKTPYNACCHFRDNTKMLEMLNMVPIPVHKVYVFIYFNVRAYVYFNLLLCNRVPYSFGRLFMRECRCLLI